MKALVGAFNQEKALVGAFSVIVQPVVKPMEHYTALPRKLLPVRRRLLQQLVDLPGGFPNPLVLVTCQGLVECRCLKPQLCLK